MGHPKLLARPVAIGILLGLIAVSVVVTAQPAAAATRAHGFQGGTGAGAGWLGNVSVPSGALAYCVDPAGIFPSGTTTNAGLIGGIPGTSAAANPGHNGTRSVTGIDMQKLNYALSTYGPGAVTDTVAAGLAAYVNSVTSSLHPGDDVSYYINIRVPVAKRAGVTAEYKTIKADANAHYGWALQTNAAHLSIAMDPTPALTGVVHVSVTPASASGTLTLVGAVFTSTGLTTSPATDGADLPITATALTGQDLYSVKVSGKFSAPTYYNPNVREYTTSSPADSQRVISAGTEASVAFTASTFVDDPRAPQFEPVLTTVVSKSAVNPGTPIEDTLTAGVDGASSPWVQNADGDFDKVVAKGTLYCGMTRDPSPGDDIPADAISEGPEVLELSGPGTYTSDGTISCPIAGYAAWVWSIDSADQSFTSTVDMPTNYSWSDEFGAVAETSFVRAVIDATTQVGDDVVGLGQPTSDVVTVELGGPTDTWPIDADGNAVPVAFTAAVYWVTGAVTPTHSLSVPSTAEQIGTASLTATQSGDYAADPVAPTGYVGGYVIWAWSTDESNYFQAWQEDFADATQTVTVSPPAITSEADAIVAVTDSANDVVTVSGPRPSFSTTLTWTAYLRSDADTASCRPSDAAFTSTSDPVLVAEPGEYEPRVQPHFDVAGTYDWVATLLAPDDSIIAQGTCGDALETSEVVPFSLVTNAVRVVADGTSATDTATISGPTPTGLTLMFNVYKQHSDGPTCDQSNLVAAGIPIPVSEPAVYESAPVTMSGDGTYFWVATARDRDGNVLNTGICGDSNEETVALGSLAFTGWMMRATIPELLAGACLTMLGLIVFRLVRRDRRRHS